MLVGVFLVAMLKLVVSLFLVLGMSLVVDRILTSWGFPELIQSSQFYIFVGALTAGLAGPAIVGESQLMLRSLADGT